MSTLEPIAASEPKLSTEDALSLFANFDTRPEIRRRALTALITAKYLPKQADVPAVTHGRAQLLNMVFFAESPEHRLLAIAECIRLGQVVKRWATEIAEQLRPAFEAELPAFQLLNDADDRLNLARACAQISTSWLPAYLARSIAEEETGEKARTELINALLLQSSSLSEVLRGLTTAFSALQLRTEALGDTAARRLTRTLSALRGVFLECEIDAGEELGKALYEFIAMPLSVIGKPQEAKTQFELSCEVLLTVHDIVRTKISVVADPQMYRVAEYCRKLCGGNSWPDELKKPLERLITDVSEALVLLGRRGDRDQELLKQLDVLCNYPERARAVARELAAKHAELPEGVRDWLEHGRIRVIRQASDSAIEAAASNADESIGLALQAARQARLLGESLREPLASNLEIYEPSLAPTTNEFLARVQILAVQVEQAASHRGLELYGTPGEEVEMSTKFFTIVGNDPRQKMIVKQPAVVRKRSDGNVGDVVTKGLVE